MRFCILSLLLISLLANPSFANQDTCSVTEAIREVKTAVEGSRTSLWAYVLGGFISGGLVFLASTLPHLLRWCKRPMLETDVDAAIGGIIDWPQPPAPPKARYVRLNVRNTGKLAAKTCRGFLTQVGRYEGNNLIDLNYHEAVEFKWACNPFPGPVVVKDIVHGLDHFLDICAADLNTHDLQLALVFLAPCAHNLINATGSYLLTILIVAENASPVTAKMRLNWNQDSNELTIGRV